MVWPGLSIEALALCLHPKKMTAETLLVQADFAE
jgi:hypothetical protein